MKWIVKMMLALLLCLPVQSWAFPNEPNGFRDLYWGESLEEVQQTRHLSFLGNTHSIAKAEVYVTFLREDEEKVVSGIPIAGERLVLGFKENKLIAIVAAFHDIDNCWEYLKGAMERLYGKAEFINGDYMWTGTKTMMLLERNFLSGQIRLCMVDLQKIKNIDQEMYKSGW